MSTDSEHESAATTNYSPTEPERASAPPPSPDPNTAVTADLPPSRAVTHNPASDRTDGHDATGAYTPGGSPIPSRPAGGTYPPVRADRYLLKQFHARGGMGEIWLAEDCDVGRAVALKKMRRKGTPEEEERFLREARITGQLEHPGIVPVHELGTDEHGQPVYVMKFVHGQTLADAVRDYHLGIKRDVPREVQLLRLLEVFVALCQTVAYAHSRGVLHRDIKPENVMLGPYGETLVLDWGLAKVIGQAEGDLAGRSVSLSMSGESVESVAGSVRGTPGYMAPEMASGKVQDIDALSDVYLLGATLYHILTGRKPRGGKSLMELLTEASTTPPVAPRKHDPNIPKALEAICQKAMAFAKADRYASAAALAEDVQRYLAGEPVLAYPESFLTRAARWARKHRQALARALAAVAILGTVLAAVLIVRSEMRKKTDAEQNAAAEKARRENEQKARDNVAQFRRLTDDSRYYLASANPATERTPYYDVNRGVSIGREALTVADTLTDLPLSEKERSEIAEQQYNLLLLLAQVQVRGGGADGAHAGLNDLERAATLRSPSPGLHRLRAECYRLLDDGRATEEQQQAERATTPQSAIDLFLLGEQDRAAALHRPHKRDIYTTWQPNRELLLKARTEFREVLRLDPTDFWANYHIGLCAVSLGQKVEAVGAFDACVALHPDSVWAYVARGLALAQVSRVDDAGKDLTRALELDRELLPARLSRGVVLMQQNKNETDDQALADFERVLSAPAEKRLLDAALYRAEIYRRRGKNEEALAELDRVATEDPKNRRVHGLRAAIHLSQGKQAETLDDFTAQLSLDEPIDANSKEAYEGRGHLLRLLSEDRPDLRKRALELGLVELNKAGELGARSAKLFDEQGTTLDALGQYKEAIEKYTAALTSMPDDLKLLTKRGWAKVNTGDAALVIQAANDFGAAIRRDHTYAEAHTGLGYVAAERGNETLALKEANLATLYAGSGDYGVLHNASTVYAALSNRNPKRRTEYEDLTIDTLRRAVEKWRQLGKVIPNELVFIENESAFQQHLKDRKEFQDIVEEARKP
jgi:tetratricopeptide (TPR) repeat protein/tRNA A-37 threonylcarbamoyl transferase component Bud32